MALSGARYLALVAGLSMAAIASAAGPTFQPQTTVTSPTGAGTQQIGGARWGAEAGGVITADLSRGGGVLMLGQPAQNRAAFAEFRCDTCEVGVLVRATRLPNGNVTGILVSAAPDQQRLARVTVGPNGAVIAREALVDKPGETGLPSSIGNVSREGRESLGGRRSVPMPAGIDLPGVANATGAYQPGGWNTLNVVNYNRFIGPTLNGGRNRAIPASTVPDGVDYGDVALFVSGTGSARFRNVLLADIGQRRTPPQKTAAGWTRLQLDGFYSTWGPAVGDIDRDGKLDVVAGPYWFKGGDFAQAREIYTPLYYNPYSDYPQKSFINFIHDFNEDGWKDVLVISGSAGFSTVTMYLNPKGERRHWESFEVIKPIGNEETLFEDIDGDGKPELIHAFDNGVAYSKWDPANPRKWTHYRLSEKGPWGDYIGHGIGIGDLNGDGRKDYLSAYGWWEQPATTGPDVLWTFHPYAFGRRGETQGGAGGAKLGVYDVNGDGLADVVTPLEGHGFGLAWHEQKRGPGGQISFVPHVIMDNYLTPNAGNVLFTEPHAAAFADMTGDGIPDMVTGKRFMSHVMALSDPDPLGPAELYVYRTVRDRRAPGGARFEPMLIDNASGVGSHIALDDVDGNGRPDITVGGALGTFVFLNGGRR